MSKQVYSFAIFACQRWVRSTLRWLLRFSFSCLLSPQVVSQGKAVLHTSGSILGVFSELLLPTRIPTQAGPWGWAYKVFGPAHLLDVTLRSLSREMNGLSTRKGMSKRRSHPAGNEELSFEGRCSLQPHFTIMDLPELSLKKQRGSSSFKTCCFINICVS